MMNRIVLYIMGLVLWVSCKHSFPGEMGDPRASRIEVQSQCAGCVSSPVCAVVDDIPVQSNTTYAFCPPTPSGQGSATLDGNNCLLWTASQNATDIVQTCLVACTNGICDTTFITILPPVPGGGMPCSSDTVYFTNDILPILTSNCAFSGCHNQASATEGVILDNYAQVIQTGKVRPGRPDNSELFEVITEDKADKVMPPPPAQRLSSQQIALIQKWIEQGAKNNQCDAGGCDTENVSYNTFVKPALSGCVQCHNATVANGSVRLDNYAGVKAAATSGRLYGAISWSQGFVNMPSGGVKMDECRIQKIKSWIDAGSPEN